MKRIALLIGALTLGLCGMQAQSVKIVKGNETIASYNLSEISEIVFTPASAAQAVEGTYLTSRTVTLPAMPQMGDLVKDEQEVIVAATGDVEVSVTLPGCKYEMNGTEFDLPGATLTNVKVEETESGYYLAGSFEGEINGKNAKIGLTGTIGADGSAQFVEDMQYGSMPMTLHMVYVKE